VSVEQEIYVEIRRLRDRLPGISGCLAVSLDGLLIASDAGAIESETLAALTATGLALGQRISTTAGYGELTETVITALGGYVGIYAAGPRALLAVLATGPVNLTRLHVEARHVAERVAAVIEVLDVASVDDLVDEYPDPDAPESPGLPDLPEDDSDAGPPRRDRRQVRTEPWPQGDPLPRRQPPVRRDPLPRREPRLGDEFPGDPVVPMPRRVPPHRH